MRYLVTYTTKLNPQPQRMEVFCDNREQVALDVRLGVHGFDPADELDEITNIEEEKPL